MSRTFSLLTITLLSLLPAVTSGAPAPKRHVAHWHGYGFLPGYHQPPNNTIPVFGKKGTVDITAIAGYYALLAMQLNMARYQSGDGPRLSHFPD